MYKKGDIVRSLKHVERSRKNGAIIKLTNVENTDLKQKLWYIPYSGGVEVFSTDIKSFELYKIEINPNFRHYVTAENRINNV
jgi:hypothetical protein